jgi:hypothetical protein
MHVTFGPKGILIIDDARIIHRNFSGAASKFNAAGSRNFSVVIEDEEVKDALVEEGWNVKIRAPREPGDAPFMFLPVKVNFNYKPPKVYLVSGNRKTELDEETIDMLDNIDILTVDLDISPSNYDVNGRTGVAAYLKSMQVVQEVDRFADRFND